MHHNWSDCDIYLRQMAKDDLILMAEQGRMIGLLLLLYYYFQCLLKFCREEEASGSVVHVHSNKGISFLGGSCKC